MPWYKVEFTEPVPDVEWIWESRTLTKIERKDLYDQCAERFHGSDYIRGEIAAFAHPPIKDCRAMIVGLEARITHSRQRIRLLRKYTSKAHEAAERLSGPPPELPDELIAAFEKQEKPGR